MNLRLTYRAFRRHGVRAVDAFCRARACVRFYAPYNLRPAKGANLNRKA